ncbi:hypothetical protein H0O03_02320 [Candidatus Micrarchaeota archaeon]|nr:hypothetical protein [Candidatus Micrarchaeota archaeon]
MARKAQGSLEYIVLIGAVLFFIVLVVVVTKTNVLSGGSETTQTNMQQWNTTVNAACDIGIPCPSGYECAANGSCVIPLAPSCTVNITAADLPYTTTPGPGVYCLTEDAALPVGNAITITSSDVELNCFNHVLSGAGPVCGAMQVGVFVGPALPALSNVTVKNCNLHDFCGAMYLANMTSGNVSYNDAHDNYYGLVVAGNGTTYSSNNVSSNLFRGFAILSQSFSNIFSSNRACDNNCSGGTCQDFRFGNEQTSIDSTCGTGGCYQSAAWPMCSSGLGGYSNCNFTC